MKTLWEERLKEASLGDAGYSGATGLGGAATLWQKHLVPEASNPYVQCWNCW